MELIADLTLVLVAALVGGFLAHRVGQPLIVGYIVASENWIYLACSYCLLRLQIPAGSRAT